MIPEALIYLCCYLTPRFALKVSGQLVDHYPTSKEAYQAAKDKFGLDKNDIDFIKEYDKNWDKR